MRLITLFSVMFLGFSTLTAGNDTVSLVCELTGCEASPQLFSFNGIGFYPVAQAQGGEDGVFEFRVPRSEPVFYYIGVSEDQLRPLILGPEERVMLRGSCNNIRSAHLSVSVLNKDYELLKQEINDLKNQTSQLIRQYRIAQRDPGQLEKVVADMKALDDRKLAFLDSVRTADPYFGSVVAINTYLSYQNNGGAYNNEVEYFAREYFRWVDFSQEVYNRLPWVYEAFKSYALTLSSVGLPRELQKQFLDEAVDLTPAGSPARQMALAGVITSLRQKQQSNFPDFSERFIREFEDKEPAAVAALKEELERAKAFLVGGTPPDFTMATPEGKDLSLSELRGKVLLIDFWASWCGPCRRENPNVVRLYNEYKDKGFDILGVSLDRKKDSWLDAIEKDGLTWRHVSDLKGWQNEAAQLYGVSSIPHTVLLDGEGRIIARNLRGAALEQKLAELFE